MSLTERKIRILQAIINDYIATAEPVGSRTLAKKYNLGISSATIRNEMSDLEEMGFIIQPHASSGRIPSDLGYRLYVDTLMQSRELNENEEKFMQSIVYKNIGRIDYLMEETAKALSILTNYTTIISEPVLKRTSIKQIRLLPLDERNLILVIATKGNFVKHHVIKVKKSPNEDEIFRVSSSINKILQGHSLEEIREEEIMKLQQELKDYEGLLKPVLKAVQKTIHSAENVNVHLGGAKNILTFPEFSNIEKAKTIFQTLEQKDTLVTLLQEGKGKELQIFIGNEINVQEMKDCSLITTSYKIGENTSGSIGVIGPTRMNYTQVVSVLNGMVKNIENVLKSLSDGINEDRKE